jgi:tRNA threonylcarbamoyladenosine modification (KEOPS) complex  Pcc1 subunit
MYKAIISVDDSKGVIRKAFASEDRDIKGKASYEVKEGGGKIVFEITARDSTALRTVLNSITKMLTVIEKVGRIK